MAAQDQQSAAVAFIDSTKHPYAEPYYKAFPAEPVLPSGTLRVSSRLKLSPMTAWTLLESITKNAQKGQDIVIVCHGTVKGLDVPLSEESSAKLDTKTFRVLKKWKSGGLAQEQAASMLSLATHQLGTFRWELADGVRKLSLNRVEIRACNVGIRNDTLQMLKDFFGCKSLCAPKELDVFTPLGPDPIGPGGIELLLEKFPGAKITGKAPHRFGLHVIGGAKIEFKAVAESRQAISNWMRTHLPGTEAAATSPFFAHGIFPSKGRTRMVWAGEKGYRGYLARVKSD
jgi:hypothetical protein